MIHLSRGPRIESRRLARARDSTPRLHSCVLCAAMCLSASAVAQTQTVPAPHRARPTLTREANMTQLNTVDAPVAATASREAPGEDAIRPFRARISDADVADLRRRLKATRFPDKETVADASQCSGRAPARYLHVSGICTSPLTICPGGGRMRVTTTPST